MLKEFKEFYGSLDIEPEAIDQNTLICFDANVLLHIYRYSDETRTKLFEAMKKVKEHIFIPYHASLEFNLNKKKILNDVLNMENKIKNAVVHKSDAFFTDISSNVLDNHIKIRSQDEKAIREDIKKKFKQGHDKFIDDWIKNDLNKEFELIKGIDERDELSNDLAKLLDGKVGESFDQEKINKIEKEGEERYSNEIPPGYKDDTDPNKQDIIYYSDIHYTKKYGDLIIWHQILDEIKKREQAEYPIKKVIIVTDDFKDDWVYIVNGQTKGVRVELRKEMLDKTKAYLHIKNTNGFLKMVLNIEEELIQNVLENSRFIEDLNRELENQYPYISRIKNNENKIQVTQKNMEENTHTDGKDIYLLIADREEKLEYFKNQIEELFENIKYILKIGPINNQENKDTILSIIGRLRRDLEKLINSVLPYLKSGQINFKNDLIKVYITKVNFLIDTLDRKTKVLLDSDFTEFYN